MIAVIAAIAGWIAFFIVLFLTGNLLLAIAAFFVVAILTLVITILHITTQ